ncbi:MAG: RNA-binding S4 domain-containing protein [Bauldia sp.]|nr:RNA-binding S4 domain-containing protein [Bauldia sp.]
MTHAREPRPDRQRIDRWLWHARLARTRSAAQALATSGQVRVNRERSESASRAVKLGDVLTVAFPTFVRVLRVTGFSERRGSATDAGRLYEDLAPRAPGTASPEVSEDPMSDPGGRPDKHARKDLIALKRGNDEDAG